jgi:4-aminobutyrate aminotransferase-like enzyme
VHFVEPCRCGLEGERAEACRCADAIADVLDRSGDDIAAVLLEPILVDAGVIVQSRRFLHDVRRLTSEAHVPLVFDEIQTGFGWTGRLFASDLYGVVPDIMTLGKGMACSLPLAAILTTESLDVLDYGEHEIGPGGNQLLCAVALANLEMLLTTDLLADVEKNGALLEELLRELQCDLPDIVSDVRGVGLLHGVELQDDSPDSERTRRLVELCLEAGLLVRTSKIGRASNVLQIKPPLITRRASLERGVDILRHAIRRAWR